jgi:general secretion pathway protein D
MVASLVAQEKSAPQPAPVLTPAGQPVPRAVPIQLGTNAPAPAKAAAVPIPVSPAGVVATPFPAPATAAPQPPATAPKAAAPATVVAIPATTAPATTTPSPAPASIATGTAGEQAAKVGPRIPPRADKTIPPGMLKFNNTPLEQVLEVYAELTGRTVLRSPTAALPSITIKSQTELTVEEAIQALDSLFALHGLATVPIGDKFITITSAAGSLQEAATFNTLTNSTELPEASQYVTKVIQLKEVKPSEIVTALQPFARIQGGILPIDTTQVLIIRDFAINVKRMMELIEKIDQAVPLEENMRVFPIRYALASEVASVLGTLTTAGATTGGGAPTSSTSRGGIRRPSTGQGVTGGFQGFNPAGQLQPGQPGQIQPQVGIQQQPGQAAAGFQQRLQQIVNQASRGTAGGAALLGAAKIITYERNNSILAIGTKQELEMVEKLIQELDKVQKQVLIEAIILEVTLDDSKKLGVSTAQNQKKFGENFTGRGGVRTDAIFGSGLTNAANQSLPQGLSYFANLGKAWELAVQAIATDSTVNVLSRPRIQTSHAETATLFVGDTVPYINATYANLGGTPTSSYQQKDIGIQLQVQPLINEDGLVVMDIAQNIEQLGPTQTIDNNQVPTTTKRQATAKVAVKDGDTIILGGYITTQKSRSKTGVPGLKDIPGLGVLFRSTSDTVKRTELIVLIRPTVLPTPEMASVTAQKEREKMFGVVRAEKEILDDEKKRAERNKLEVEKLEREQRERDARKPPGR